VAPVPDAYQYEHGSNTRSGLTIVKGYQCTLYGSNFLWQATWFDATLAILWPWVVS